MGCDWALSSAVCLQEVDYTRAKEAPEDNSYSLDHHQCRIGDYVVVQLAMEELCTQDESDLAQLGRAWAQTNLGLN